MKKIMQKIQIVGWKYLLLKYYFHSYQEESSAKLRGSLSTQMHYSPSFYIKHLITLSLSKDIIQ